MPTERVEPVAKPPSALQSGEKQIADIATLVRSPLLSGLNLQDVGALLEHLEVVVAPVDVPLATGADGHFECANLRCRKRRDFCLQHRRDVLRELLDRDVVDRQQQRITARQHVALAT